MAAFCLRVRCGSDQHVVLTTDNEKYTFRWFDWVTEEHLIIEASFTHWRANMESVETRIMLAGRDGSEVKGDLIVGLRPFYGDWKSVMQFQDGVIDVVHDRLPHDLIVLAKANLLYPSAV